MTIPSEAAGQNQNDIFGGMCVPCSPLQMFRQAKTLSGDPISLLGGIIYETPFRQNVKNRNSSTAFAQS